MKASSNKFIVIGEDDKDDQELLEDVFEAVDDSYRLIFVDNGKEMISLLKKLHEDQVPCLIVLDYNMPGLCGADILEEINALPAYHHIPKVVWSTSGSEKFKNKCLELGALDYVIKPSSFAALEDVVRYLMSICHLDFPAKSNS
jgi:CheY-like chemotaxis protein